MILSYSSSFHVVVVVFKVFNRTIHTACCLNLHLQREITITMPLEPVQPIVKSECHYINGMKLPAPRDGSSRYHRSEIANMMLDYGRKYVINAIADTKCYQMDMRL